MNWQLHQGDALAVLQTLPEASVDCVVTSPPYFKQRDYKMPGQIGLEAIPAEYVAALVAVFAALWRVLKPSGAVWLNLGDSYAAGGHGGGGSFMSMRRDSSWGEKSDAKGWRKPPAGLKPKDLIGIPWMVAFALRDAGWYLRSETIWHKPNCFPGSVLDRPTSAHETCFLLSRSRRYFFNSHAIREPLSASMLEQMKKPFTGQARKDYDGEGLQNPSDVKRRILAGRTRTDKQRGHSRRHAGFNARWDAMPKAEQMSQGSLPRDVWTISPTHGGAEAIEHYAMMPKALAKKMILSASPATGVVCDPFCGSGTTGVVALEEGRSFVGIELSPKYHAIGRERLAGVAPLLATEISA